MCDGAQKAQLVCVDGKLAPTRTCHGARGCETAPGGGVRCDRTVALEDEACSEEGTGACDTTRKNVLVCRAATSRRSCTAWATLGCELPGNYSVRCDKSIVPMSEPCDEDGAVSCSTDGKQVQCTSGKWALDKNWKPKKGETCSNRYRHEQGDREVRGAIGHSGPRAWAYNPRGLQWCSSLGGLR